MMREPVGLILAGGRATRMGGVPKAGVILDGRPLLDHCIARLAPQVRALAVNANDPFETSLPVLPDTMPGHLGPLAGILAGLDWAAAQGATHLVSVAVDTPFFPCDLVPQLIMAGASHASGMAIAATPDGDHGTFGIWPVVLRADLAAYLQDGGRKVRTFTDGQHAGRAHFADQVAFFNINTPDDLAKAETWM